MIAPRVLASRSRLCTTRRCAVVDRLCVGSFAWKEHSIYSHWFVPKSCTYYISQPQHISILYLIDTILSQIIWLRPPLWILRSYQFSNDVVFTIRPCSSFTRNFVDEKCYQGAFSLGLFVYYCSNITNIKIVATIACIGIPYLLKTPLILRIQESRS